MRETAATAAGFTRAIASAVIGTALVAGPVSAQQTEAQVTVSPAEARAFIPLDRTVGFVWQRRTLPADVLEYEFRVTVESAAGRHDFGFSLYRRHSAPEGRGDLAALLAAGQSTAWRVAWDDGRLTGYAVTEWSVEACARPGGVELVLEGEDAVAGIFHGLPQTVSVVRLVPDAPTWRVTVPVAYR